MSPIVRVIQAFVNEVVEIHWYDRAGRCRIERHPAPLVVAPEPPEEPASQPEGDR